MTGVLEYKRVNIGIGDIVVTRERAMLMTVLGSCVSVCLLDPHHGLAGMNHFLLPEAMGRPGPPGRCGTTSIPALVDEILKAGARRGQLVAKVFGGGQVLAPLSGSNSVADRNAQVARRVLDELRIPVSAEDLGGNHGRKVQFFTDTGKVVVQSVSSARLGMG